MFMVIAIFMESVFSLLEMQIAYTRDENTATTKC